jgi:hypothetical protein
VGGNYLRIEEKWGVEGRAENSIERNLAESFCKANPKD